LNEAHRDLFGPVVAGCELRWATPVGARRPHYYTGVLRDQIGNLWCCEEHHSDQDSAHVCAKVELERRFASGELKSRFRRGDV
jgi:hypothetical protein